MKSLSKYTALLILICALSNLAWSCTDFIIGCKDGTTVHGRTMEFELYRAWSIRSHPAGYVEKGTVPENCQNNFDEPLAWKTLYKTMLIEEDNIWIDAVNSEGLSAGALSFKQYGLFAEHVPAKLCGNTISQVQMVNYLIGKIPLKVFWSNPSSSFML